MMKAKTIFILTLVLSILFSLQLVAAQPSCGSTITTNTILDSDMYCNGTAIIIGANNTVLDCAGHTITPSISSYTPGIKLSSVSGSVIKNCNIINSSGQVDLAWFGSVGIELSSSSNNVLINNNISARTYSIHLESSSNNSIVGNNIISTLRISESSNITLVNNSIAHSMVFLWSGSGHIIIGNNITTLRASGDFAFRLSSISNSVLIGNKIASDAGGIVLSHNSPNNTVANNTISTGGSGIWLEFGSNNTFARNIIIANGDGIRIFPLYYGSSTYNNILTNNTVIVRIVRAGQWATGISVASNNTLIDNTVTTSNHSCPGISIGSDNTLKNNRITTSGTWSYGVSAGSNNTLINNEIFTNNNGSRGISIGSNNILTNNNITTNAEGIYIPYGGSNNSLTGNIIAVSSASPGISFLLRASDSNNVLSNNSVTSSLSDGVFISSGAKTAVTRNKISNSDRCVKLSSTTNNTIRGNSCKHSKQGIVSDPSSNNLIDSNEIQDITEYGIFLDGSLSDSVTNNTIFNALTGVGLSGATDSTISLNTIENTTTPILILLSMNTIISDNTLQNNAVNAPVADSFSAATLSSDVPPACVDMDGDGYSGTPNCGPDCDDTNASINPGAAEIPCNGIDENCNGMIDDRPDRDADGIDDCTDACPAVYGYADRQGCLYGDSNLVELHIIDQAKSGACGTAGSCKFPIEGAAVRVFNRNDPFFQALWTKNPSGTKYSEVYENDVGRIATCTTDTDGTCYAGEANIGDYLVILKYYDAQTGKTVYTGKPKSPSDFVNGIAFKDFQIIKTLKKDGSIQFTGGSKLVITGSYLEIIHPEAAIWESSSYVYPFIFTSDSDWSVDVCAQIPSGYKIVGVYDELGNLLSSSECAQTFVAGQTKVVAFDVLETGSPEPNFKATLKVKGPKGKVHALDLNIPGKRVAKGKAKGITGAVIDTVSSNYFAGTLLLVIAVVLLLIYLELKRQKR